MNSTRFGFALAIPLLALLAGASSAGEKDPETAGLAWFKRLDRKASVELVSEDTLLVRKKRKLTAYSLAKGEERWSSELLLQSNELVVRGDAILERTGAQGVCVRDLHQGTQVKLSGQVSSFAAAEGRFFLGTLEGVSARSIQGEELWSFPKAKRELPAGLGYVTRLESSSQGLLLGGKRLVVCLRESGKPRWDYELKEPEQIEELFVDEEGLVVRSATHLHFVDLKRGKRRARVALPEGSGKLRPGEAFALPAKRNRTFVLTRRLGKEGASFSFYDFKGKLRTEAGGLRDGCRGGPEFQVAIQQESGYRVQSPAGRRLFEGEGQLVESLAARESYVRQSQSEGATLLERLETKRGKVEVEVRLEGEWRLVQAPGVLIARRGRLLRLHDPQTLELRSEAKLPEGARLRWSGRQLYFTGQRYFGALPTP